MSDYPIDWYGTWSEPDLRAAYAGVELVDALLARYTGLAPGESIGAVYGRLVFKTSGSLQDDLHEFVYPDGTTMYEPGLVTANLTAHALGHGLDVRLIGSPWRPSTVLRREAIKDENGRMVGGAKWGWVYYRYGAPRLYPPENGYPPGVEQHPCPMKGWEMATEGFADMLLVHALGAWLANPAGRAIGTWMEVWMPVFVGALLEKNR